MLGIMIVKSLIFLSSLIVVTGNLSAGVISATWLEQGCGASAPLDFEANQHVPAPCDDQKEGKDACVCAANVGMSGLATAGAGSFVSLFAVAETLSSLLLEPNLFWRLKIEDDSLPPSPVLSGLLKPS